MNAKFSSKNGHARKMEKNTAKGPAKLFQNTAKALLWVLGLTLVISLFVAAVFYSTSDPARYIAPASLTLFLVAAFLGGFLSGKKQKSSALLCGLLFAVMWLIVTGLTSFLFDMSLSENRSFSLAVALRGIAVCLSVFGAFVGTSQKKKKSGKRKYK